MNRINNNDTKRVSKKIKLIWPAGLMLLAGILLLITFCGVISANAKEAKNADMMAKELESNKEDMMNELTTVSTYLDTLDKSVVTNKETLEEITVSSTDITTQISELETSLARVENMFSSYLQSQKVENEETKNTLVTITEELSSIRKELAATEEELISVLEGIGDMEKENAKLITDKIELVQEKVDANKERMELCYESVVTLLDEMSVTNEKHHNEMKDVLVQAEKALNDLIVDKMLTLTELIQFNCDLLKTLVEERVTYLSEQMTSLHDQINVTKESISELLSKMETINAENQQEIMEQFNDIKDSINSINQDFTVAHDEIKKLITDLSKTEAANHTELLNTLNAMEVSMNEDSINNLEQILGSLSSFEERYTITMENLTSKMDQSFFDMNSNISNQMTKLGDDIDNNFSSLSETVNNQYQSITTIVNQGDDGLRGYLDNIFSCIESDIDQVFRFVSDGKRLLASALLTKGVPCAEDASFAEIYQAILDVPQSLVIGVKEIPGTISYDYHYHTDGKGNQPHTDTCGVAEAGGCYSIPIYHSHSGSSSSGGGCYTVRRSGTRTEGCGGGGQCNSGPHGPDTSGQVYYVGNCTKCGEHLSVYGSAGYKSCPNKRTVSYTYYDLGCGKGTSTVVGYKTSCGLSDGQIIGAHIVYESSAVAVANAYRVQPMMCVEPEEIEESPEPETIVEEDVVSDLEPVVEVSDEEVLEEEQTEVEEKTVLDVPSIEDINEEMILEEVEETTICSDELISDDQQEQ